MSRDVVFRENENRKLIETKNDLIYSFVQVNDGADDFAYLNAYVGATGQAVC